MSGTRGRALWPATLGVMALACSAPRQSGEAVAPAAPADPAGAPPAQPVEASASRFANLPGGPEILLPSADSRDDAVVEVGDLKIHKRHLYDRLQQDEPGAIRAIVELMTLDVLVAELARAFEIRVDEAAVDRTVAEMEQALRSEVESKLGPRVSFDDYLLRRSGMTAAEYPQWLRTKQTRELYREYVLRYVSLRDDRVEVRYIVTGDRELIDDIAAKVRQGADFATLAIRHTEDPNRIDGGLLPPFARGYDHPIAAPAFDLDPGQLSPVIEREIDGDARYYLVYCLRKLAGRDLAFAEVRDELDEEIARRPLPRAEFESAAKLLRARFDELRAGSSVR